MDTTSDLPENNSTILISHSLRVTYHKTSNTMFFKGRLDNSDEHKLSFLFRKMKKIIIIRRKLTLNLEQLEFLPHTGISLFYQLVKIRLDQTLYFSFITSHKMQWQHNWLNNIKKLSMSVGNQSCIDYKN